MASFLSLHVEAICAVILLWVVGTAIGNYVCSVVYRLPRGQTPFEKHPYCGSCGTMLKPIDLFPVFSYLSTRGKCRYCGAGIPSVYTLIELGCAAVMIGNYFTYGMGEAYIAMSAAAVFILTAAAIGIGHGFISSFLYLLAYGCMLLGISTLNAGSFLPAIQQSVVMLVAALSITALVGKMKGQALDVGKANAAWWLALWGVMISPTHWNIYALLLLSTALVAMLVSRAAAIHAWLPCALVIMIGMFPLL